VLFVFLGLVKQLVQAVFELVASDEWKEVIRYEEPSVIHLLLQVQHQLVKLKGKNIETAISQVCSYLHAVALLQ
jgi:hypothetical protein